MEKQFETDDITLAAYLRVHGVQMLRTYRSRHRVYFEFDNEDGRASQLADTFYDSVEGKRAHDLIRQYRLVRGLALDLRLGAQS